MVWMGRRRTGEEDEEEERCHMWHGLVLGRPGLIAGPCGHRGARWRRLAGVVGDLEAILGLLGCILPLPWRHIGAILGRRWDILATLGGGAYWAYWKLLGEFGPSWGNIRGRVRVRRARVTASCAVLRRRKAEEGKFHNLSNANGRSMNVVSWAASWVETY